MDGTICTQQTEMSMLIQHAMQNDVAYNLLRQQIWGWGAQNGWYHTTVEIIGEALLISYFPSLRDGLVCERIPVPIAYQSLLPSSDW